YPNSRYFYLTTKSDKSYTDIVFREDDMLVFGKETKGLPEDLLKRNADYCFRIPMIDKARSLNLSNAVAIVSYEALRQLGFPGMTGGKGIENL
ncbi:MAG: tRNA (uridine(34)/cytosine(34)/5-carboxymethylaminomethyluridine(34)-2'-O)-methyltransferase TrmL, partial [Megasphaera micronuciformis]|nr:tRNA (uridine(34)/cytosine(34)/5-carboxymethylaminomethyluridine(34)-2'-O)-methyltransferase TrmL [Megasphaera micronuciformis]